MARRLRALRLVHPYPSILNAALVAWITVAAGARPDTTILLTAGMLGMQFAIGAANDIVDRDLDARGKPSKPIPAGLVGLRTATAVAALSAAVGFTASALAGPLEALLWLVMLACGLVYNLWLKPTPWAWLCFSIAFALLPIYGWYGATEQFPPLWQFVVFLAVLAGPFLSLANGLIDFETDRAAGLRTPPAMLGRRRSLIAMAILFVLIHGTAWAVVAPIASSAALAYLAIATALGAVGLGLSAGSPASRQLGSNAQFFAVFLLALAWLVTVS